MKTVVTTNNPFYQTSLIIALILFVFPLFGQVRSKVDLARQMLQDRSAKTLLTAEDLSNMRVSSETFSKKSGVTHVYFQQEIDDVPIHNAILDAHVTKDNKLLTFNSRFLPQAKSKAAAAKPTLTAVQAVEAAALALGIPINEPLSKKEGNESGPIMKVLFEKGDFSLEDIPVQLVWQPMSDTSSKTSETYLRLAWDLSIYEIGAQNWWSVRIDAQTGELLDKNNWVVHCSFGEEHHDHQEIGNWEIEKLYDEPISQFRNSNFTPPFMSGGSYRVFPEPLENPYDGPRQLITNPATGASPFGWHDTDGAAGHEYTITQGNNVHAYTDIDFNNQPDPNSSPNGGQALVFDYPLDLTEAPATYRHAAVTNLFYWNNYLHDFAHSYGFDEAAGNFQQNNYGNGGVGNDYVLAEAQDGSGVNNANFATPPDGSKPRMQMFLGVNPNPDIDGSFDNGIVAHEYAHGISNRLTGGPATVFCLQNQEQMGEGWSDYFALITTMQPGDIGTTPRPVGAYLIGQPANGNGIRPTPYSTNMSVNPATYNTIKTVAAPHGVGYVWAGMLWDMTWALIEAHGQATGYDEAINLVMEGMKLQPCSPGFVNGRDAILAADSALYGGANQCLIWQVFARRGLGFSASQGSSNSLGDGTEAFDLPPTLPCLSASANPAVVCISQNKGLNITANSNISGGDLTLTVSGEPAGVTHIFFNNNPLAPGATSFLAMIADSFTLPGVYPILVTGTNGSGSFTTTFMLEVRQKPGATTLTSPVNGATDLPTIVTLNWDAVPGASRYVVTFWKTTEPDPGPFNGFYHTGTSFTLNGLLDNTTYNWRIATYNSPCLGVASPIWSFTTNCTASNPAPTLLSPANGATGLSVSPLLDWTDVPNTTNYHLQIATDAGFNNLVLSDNGISQSSTFPNIPLAPNTEYFWRVSALSACNPPLNYSPAFSFTTDGTPASCDTTASTNVPITIPPNVANTITSTINIAACGTVADVNVLNLNITHIYNGFLEIELTSPAGTTVMLYDKACFNHQNILTNFDDEATAPYNSWTCPPTGNDTFRPLQQLSAFDGQSITGIWTLTVRQNGAFFGLPNNSLNGWGLGICSVPASGTLITCFRDADADSYGDPNLSQSACTTCQPGWVLDNTDCNDSNASINPVGTEVCDFTDNNCNGQVDEGFTIVTCYQDLDVDGYGSAAATKQFCGSCGIGYAPNSDDCNDNNPDSHPGATEICDLDDNDCDGMIDEGFVVVTCYRDADGDTYGDPNGSQDFCSTCGLGFVANNDDCDDNNNAINPGATEICDFLDNDCDGLTDEGFTVVSCFQDSDSDGFGNVAVSQLFCDSCGTGYVIDSTDCNDNDSNINPNTTEICDLVDNNCDGTIDEGFDADGDGFTVCNGDCNDSDSTINPNTVEVCDGIDNNCDGITDFPPDTTYVSSDVPITIPSSGTPTVTSTLTISGATQNIVDLNVKDLKILHTWMGDLDVTLTSPGGTVLTLFSTPLGSNCGQDNILATFDDAAPLTATDFENTCNTSSSPTTYAISGTYQPVDALTALNGTNPNGVWTLTVKDNFSGDGGTIESWGLQIFTPGVTTTYYTDADGDGYGDPAASVELNCTPTTGFVLNNTDCNDSDSTVHPTATEVCNGKDDNCVGGIDEGTVCCPDGIVYVKADATGLNNGSSWGNAFTNPQNALASTCPDVGQIWVATGTYKPTSGTDRFASFALKDSFALYGGLVGNEPTNYDLNLRDFAANPTILSGDIGTPGTQTDNSYNVVTSINRDSSAVIDGFTITGGYGDTDFGFPSSPSRGGGMHNQNSLATISNCTFLENTALFGGGMYNLNSSPAITNCSFMGNAQIFGGYGGGGIMNEGVSDPFISESLFEGNDGFFGGGLYFSNGSPHVDRCIFQNNTGFVGGAIANMNGATSLITNCLIRNNMAYSGGGIANYSSPTITNCTVYGNQKTNVAGGIYNEFTSPVITNCIVWGNDGTGIEGPATPIVTYSLVQGGHAGNGNIDTDPLFVDSTDQRLTPCSPALDTGSNAANATTEDLDGNVRVVDVTATPPAAIDMGAFEMQYDTTLPATWTGLGDGILWTDPANWSGGYLPQPCRHVLILSGSSVTLPAGAEGFSKTLEVETSGELLAEPTSILQVGN